MTKKDYLIVAKQFKWRDGDIYKRFNVFVYKGKAYRMAQYRRDGSPNAPVILEKAVKIKAFRIVVEEVWTWERQEFYHDREDFGYCTARGGEFAHALRRIEQECGSLDDVRRLMAELKPLFRAALDRDALRELKKLYKLYPKKKNS